MTRRRIHGTAFLDNRLKPGTLIEIEDGIFSRIEQAPPTDDALLVEGVIAPGFVDIHLHGGAGYDFSDATEPGIREIQKFHLRHGATSIAATIVSSDHEQTCEAIRAISAFEGERDSTIRAIHLEGPYISSSRCGAHDTSVLRAPDRDELEQWIELAGDFPLRMTVAPELPGALEMIERFSDRVRFSIGHTECNWEMTLEAIARGASSFTHLFNAMKSIHHREPGPVAAALLSPETTIELIADGKHLHTSILHLAAKLAGHRIALVTDAMRAAGKGDGEWKLGTLDVTVSRGEARTSEGALAGSLLTMDRAMKNMVEKAGVPLETVLPMVTSIPGSALGTPGLKGTIRIGNPADLVFIGPNLEIEGVVFGGEDVL